MNSIERLHATLAAVCPILGVSVPSVGSSVGVVVSYDPAATAPQISAAQSALAAFNWSQSSQNTFQTQQDRTAAKAAFASSTDSLYKLLRCQSDIIRQQLDSGIRERLIVQTARADGRRVTVGLEQEPGSGGKESAQLTVKRLAGFRTRVIVASSTGSKEDRADMWSTLVNQNCFRMKPGPWNQTLLDEMRYFPLSTYKDQIDGGSVAFAVINSGTRRVGAAV